MSKENIHIDDLFKPLKGYQHPVEGGFAEVNDKLHDEAWKDQFEDYEHAVSDIPDFSALPMATTDKTPWGKSAGKIALIIGLIALLSFGGYTAYNSLSKNPLQATNQSTEITIPALKNETELDAIPESGNDAIKLENENTPAAESTISDASSGSMTDGNKANPTTPTNASKHNSQHTGKGLNNADPARPNQTPNIKTNPNPAQELGDKAKENNPNTSTPSKETPSAPKRVLNDKTNPLDKDPAPIVPSESKPLTKENTASNAGVGRGLEPKRIEAGWFAGQRGINPFATAASVPSLVKFKRKNLLPKPRLSYYAQLGLGLLSPNAPFADATPAGGLTYQAHVGIQYARFSFYSGLERSNYTYNTSLRKLQVYDSFPHRNMNGDTIGWFKKNFRDTTINQNNSSRVVINSIPLHFQFKALQLGKMNVQLGTGLNVNFIRAKELWFRDHNDYLINHAGTTANTAKINLGLSIMARVGYRITPLTEIYGRLNMREAGNIFNSNNPALKPSGVQLDFGIRYHLK